MKLSKHLRNFIFFSCWFALAKPHLDVNIVGLIGIESTAPLIGTTIMDTLKDHVSINVLSSRPSKGLIHAAHPTDLPFNTSTIHIDKKPYAAVSLFTDVIGYKNELFYQNTPKTHLKIAYSMFEATQLPSLWIGILNSFFDAVVVPDESLIAVYQTSGIKIPIFVIPLPLYLEDIFERPLKTKSSSKNFVFGISAGFSERKNYGLLLKAFASKFGKNPNVLLKIHGSWGDVNYIEEKIHDLYLTNVQVINRKFTRCEYIDFIASLDAYIFPSMGEGYSITPRDALALGIPCVLSSHGVHKALCTLKSVIPITMRYKKKAFFAEFDEYCGFFYQADVKAAIAALNEVYTNYDRYLSKNREGREWVKQFTRNSLAPYFVTLVKPDHVRLGATNKIEPGTLTTNSKRLYDKYISLDFNKGKNT